MKALYAVLAALILASCGSSATSETSSLESTAVKPDSLRIMETVTVLASDSLQGRAAGTEGDRLAVAYLTAQLKKYGIQPYYQGYLDPVEGSAAATANVIAVIPGRDPELKDQILMLGAHMDHIGMVGKEGDADRIANGANDNASGSAVILELARILSAGKQPARSIVFAWFAAEENGLLGSRALANQMKSEEVDLYALVNFEMVGVPMKDKSLLYLTGHKLSNMADLINTYSGEDLVAFFPGEEEYQLFRRSDNLPFYEALGIPAHTLSSFDFTNFNHYHQPGDEASLMNYSHMQTVVEKVLPVIRTMAETKEKEVMMNEQP